MKYTFTLKDQYKKLKEIYPDIEVKVAEQVEYHNCSKIFDEYLNILNVVTGCYDKLWISESFFEKESHITYFIKPTSPFNKVLNGYVLNEEQYKKFQQAINDQMGDCTGFVSFSLQMFGHEQYFNIDKEDIGEE